MELRLDTRRRFRSLKTGKGIYFMPGCRNSRFFFVILGAVLLLVTGVVAGSFRHVVSANQQPALPQPVQRDVTYCTAGGVALKMDIYAPEKLDGASPSGALSPVAMFVHGGAWSGGDKAS